MGSGSGWFVGFDCVAVVSGGLFITVVSWQVTHAWRRYQDVDCGFNVHAVRGFRRPLIGGHERAGVMLDRLEHLLPIPTGAKMDRWRKRWYRGKKDEVKGEETKMHKRHFRASCTQTRWVTWSLWWCHHINRIVILFFNTSCVCYYRNSSVSLNLYLSITAELFQLHPFLFQL